MSQIMNVVIDRDEVDYETRAVGSWLVTLKGGARRGYLIRARE